MSSDPEDLGEEARPRGSALRRGLFVLGLLLCLAAWGRVLWKTAGPSPGRYVAFRTAEGKPVAPAEYHDHPVHPTGPVFVDADTLWTPYRLERGGEAEEVGLVRYDLPRGVARLIPLSTEGALLAVAAVAREEGGATAWLVSDAPGSSWLVRIAPDGRVEDLGPVAPSDPRSEHLGRHLRGLAWANGDLEVLLAHPDAPAEVTRCRYDSDGSWRLKELAVEVPREPEHRTEVELGYRRDGGWDLVFSRVPARAPGEGPVTVELLRARAGEDAELLGSFPLVEYGSAGYEVGRGVYHRREGGRVDWTHELDRSWGNLASDDPVPRGDPVHELAPTGWRPVRLPSGEPIPRRRALLGSDPHYRLGPPRLNWVPRAHTKDGGVAARLDERWVWIGRDADRAARVGEPDGARGPPLTREWRIGPHSVLVPSSDGGYWLLDAYSGTHVGVTEGYERADPLGFFERVALVYARLGRLSPRHGDFHATKVPLKLLALPVPLLLFPALVGVAWIGGRRLAGGRALTVLLGVYVVAAGALGPWLWRLTRYF